jgi:hypothetical protein
MSAFEELEFALANNQPFGNADSILEEVVSHYRTRLLLLAEHLPASPEIAAQLKTIYNQSNQRVLLHPAVRGATDTAIVHYKYHIASAIIDEATEVLESALDDSHRIMHWHSRLRPLKHSLSRSSERPHHIYLWQEVDNETPATKFLRLLLDLHIGENLQRLPRVIDTQTKVIADALTLLEAVLPELSLSALKHCQVIVLAQNKSGFTAMTSPGVSGALLVSPIVLANPWRAAEYLLHESMHLKFIDLEHTHSMVCRGYYLRYQEAGAEWNPAMFRAPWNESQHGGATNWSIVRVLTVFHVYITLALLFFAFRQAPPGMEEKYGPCEYRDLDLQFRTCLERANLLRIWLEENGDDLGEGGHTFLTWLTEMLNRAGQL